MKPKELFDRLVKRDGYVMYNNQGIIAFDEKGNKILSSSVFLAELIPDYVVQAEGADGNPFFYENLGCYCYFVSNENVTTADISIILDSGESFTGEFEDNILIDDFTIENSPEEIRGYLLSKKGWYLVPMSAEWPNSPISYGQHSLVVTIKDVTIYDGTFTLEEPLPDHEILPANIMHKVFSSSVDGFSRANSNPWIGDEYQGKYGIAIIAKDEPTMCQFDANYYSMNCDFLDSVLITQSWINSQSSLTQQEKTYLEKFIGYYLANTSGEHQNPWQLEEQVQTKVTYNDVEVFNGSVTIGY